MTNTSRRLYQFASITDFNDKLEQLAGLAESENWINSNATPQNPYPILFNYLHNTFIKVESEGKIAFSSDRRYSCFNTGLATPNQEAIFMVFEENTNSATGTSWKYHRFCRKSERDMVRFSPLPDIAHYFDDPSSLVFDHRIELRINIDHIVSDNKERFPEPYRNMDDYPLQTYIRGVIENAVERAKRNYQSAIPQYYQGRIQLLLPLCLSNPRTADLALVLDKHQNVYRAATCITLDMAYNNARQIARPDRGWLQP